MSGRPWQALKEGCLGLADKLFSNADQTSIFDNTFMVFFGCGAYPVHIANRQHFESVIRRETCGDGTAFDPCFDYIR